MKPDETVVGLKRATATFNQHDYEVTKLVDGRVDAKDGWGIAGGEGKAQTAVFEFASPLPAGEMTFKLVQNYGSHHTLGRFRLAVTDSVLPSLAPPASLDSVLAIASEKRSAGQKKELLKWYQKYATATADIRRQIGPL